MEEIGRVTKSPGVCRTWLVLIYEKQFLNFQEFFKWLVKHGLDLKINSINSQVNNLYYKQRQCQLQKHHFLVILLLSVLLRLFTSYCTYGMKIPYHGMLSCVSSHLHTLSWKLDVRHEGSTYTVEIDDCYKLGLDLLFYWLLHLKKSNDENVNNRDYAQKGATSIAVTLWIASKILENTLPVFKNYHPIQQKKWLAALEQVKFQHGSILFHFHLTCYHKEKNVHFHLTFKWSKRKQNLGKLQ